MELRKQANNNQRTQLPDQPGREKDKGHHTAQKPTNTFKFYYQRQHNAGKACVDDTQTTIFHSYILHFSYIYNIGNHQRALPPLFAL
jgi:hypothetical protein